MSSKTGLSRRELRRIEAAIAAAEIGHRGEICVHIEARYPGDGPLERAHQLFDIMGLANTADGTGALLYWATQDRRAALWLDEGLYVSQDEDFWKSVIASATRTWAEGRHAAAVIAAVQELGRLMTIVAPGQDIHGNELPNRVTTS